MSKLRINQQIRECPTDFRPDLIFVLSAMRLMSSPIEQGNGPRTELYRATRECGTFLEDNNLFSLRLMQGFFLIALYEAAHCIYPAAYMTMGRCARIGSAMGLRDFNGTHQMFPPSRE